MNEKTSSFDTSPGFRKGTARLSYWQSKAGIGTQRQHSPNPSRCDQTYISNHYSNKHAITQTKCALTIGGVSDTMTVSLPTIPQLQLSLPSHPDSTIMPEGLLPTGFVARSATASRHVL
jgi:hypothetical protein